MKTITYFYLFLCLLLAACSTQKSTEDLKVSGEKPSKPNIIFILADDMGFGDTGFNSSEIATPTLDHMAQTGVTLNRNYVYPVCSPTRAALLTGQNPLHMGITGPIDDTASLPSDLKTMPEYFKDLGYQTFMVGKWHLGLSKTSSWPTAKGFDYYYGFLGGWIDFYTHVYAGGLDWQRNGETLEEEGHATNLMTDEALHLINSRAKDKPFLMYLSYNAPHAPLQHVPEYSGLNDYPEISDRSVYAEMVTHMDMNIGRVMDSLNANGILEDTIVIFSSDNGGARRLGADNGDLRNGKRSSFDGGIRVPGVITWANNIGPGDVLDQPIVIYDWLPTLMDAVGGNISSDDLAGQSMWSAIANGEQIKRKPMVIGAVGDYGVFDWPWKLVQSKDDDDTTKIIELFDIVKDPNEQYDLSSQHPDITKSLLAHIEAMPTPDVNRLEREFNASPKYYPRGEPTHDLRHEATKEPWAEAAIQDDL